MVNLFKCKVFIQSRNHCGNMFPGPCGNIGRSKLAFNISSLLGFRDIISHVHKAATIQKKIFQQQKQFCDSPKHLCRTEASLMREVKAKHLFAIGNNFFVLKKKILTTQIGRMQFERISCLTFSHLHGRSYCVPFHFNDQMDLCQIRSLLTRLNSNLDHKV